MFANFRFWQARSMTYEEALDFWYSRVNYEVRSAEPGDLKLDRMRGLLKQLGDPHLRLRAVHVAGSKGKGSTSAMLAAILRQAGYHVGLFTSPHLSKVEERIQIDGVQITPAELTALMAEIQDAVKRYEAKVSGDPQAAPTFFEIVTALGFLHFVRRRVDLAILEVGLGGRFDSTNVCLPLVSVITSISFDHTRQLGSTLDRIAGEKAGIIKPRVPIISGATAPEARRVIEATSTDRQAPLRQLGIDFDFRHEPGREEAERTILPGVEVSNLTGPAGKNAGPTFQLRLFGAHQAANAALAVATVEELRAQGLRIPDAAVAAGLAGVSWPARMEVVRRRPMVVLDCAHNVASAEALVETLKTSFPPGKHWLIFAASNDKDLPGMFRALAPHFTHAFLTRYRNSPRGALPEQLAEMLASVAPLPCTAVASSDQALKAALEKAGPDDLICITGSVFLAGELRGELLGKR
jgi:dihydrofolate synthase/folylpolyglutamate synthase